MKPRVLITVILIGAIELIQLAVVRPSVSQPTASSLSRPNLNAQLKQALCAQNWSRAIQIVDQMKKVAGPQYASQLTLYRGQLAAIASENAKVPGWTAACASDNSTPEMPGSNPSSTPEMPGTNQPMINPGSTPEMPGTNQPMTNPGSTPEMPGTNQPVINPDSTPEVPGSNQ